MKKLFVSAIIICGLVLWGCETDFPGEMNPGVNEEDVRLKSAKLIDDGHSVTGALSGVVFYSGSSIPIPEVKIKVGENCTTSCADGTFCFDQVPAGNHSLQACRDEYETCSEQVFISIGEETRIQLSMTSKEFSTKLFGVVKGVNTGNPMTELKIAVLNPDGSESELVSATGYNGSFSLPAVPQGLRTLIVKIRDEEIYKEQVSLEGNEFELNLDVPDMIDFRDYRNGKIYKAIRIGTQTWMAENLAYRLYPESELLSTAEGPIDNVVGDEGFSFEETTVSSKKEQFGLLYTWDEAQEACPAGWHLPADEEWKVLEKSLGMSTAEADRRGRRQSDSEANKVKSVQNWYKEGNGDNQSGFNVQPAGMITEYGKKIRHGSHAYFWTATSANSSKAWFRDVYFAKNGINRLYYKKDASYSVRCVKD